MKNMMLFALALIAVSVSAQNASAGFGLLDNLFGHKTFQRGEVGYMCEMGSHGLSDSRFAESLRAEYKEAKGQVAEGRTPGLDLMVDQELERSDSAKGRMLPPFHSADVECTQTENGGAIINGGTGGFSVTDAGRGAHVCCLSVIKD